MGGYGSGRHGGRPTVESGLTLDLPKLLRDGHFRPACGWGGALRWTDTYSGRHIASIGYQGHLGDEDGRVRLTHTTTLLTGEKHAADYWVGLTTTPQPFGGRRWWFVCPRTGERVAKLHLPPGTLTFASRQAYRLGYRSRLGSHEGIGEFILKPKGMRWATFDRELAKIEAAETTVNGHTWALLQSLNRRLGR